MHDAYIISSSYKRDLIESIAGYGKKLIIGTKIGQLIMYSIPSVEEIHKMKIEKYSVTSDKKPICQMKVVSEENLLFVLTNGMIHVFCMGGRDFSLTHRCEEIKDCSIFATDVKITESQSGETNTMITLCVSIKRVLKFFVWKSERLEVLARQINLKDEPKALNFIDNIICVGFKDEYVAYNIFSQIPEKHDLIVTSSSNKKDPSICLIKDSIFGITKDDYLVCIDTKTKFTKYTEFVAQNKIEPIKWSSSVFDLVWDTPYVVGRTDIGVEIHALDKQGLGKYTLVQTIPSLKTVRLLVRSDNGIIFAASRTEVWYLQMVDNSLQRETLLMQRKYKLAIELTNLSSESEKLKIETIREIRTLYAINLFEEKKFASAFEEFLAAETNPYDVIVLFPVSIKGTFKTIDSPRHPNLPKIKDTDLEDATLALIDYLILTRRKKIYSNTKLIPIMDTTLLKCYLHTNDSLIAPLVRRKQCHFKESEKTLKKYNKLNELIILYQVFEEHEKALKLLKAQASILGSILFGHKRTIKYLQDLSNDHKDLVFEYSQWVLDENPQNGLTIFTNACDEPESNPIPKTEVLYFLSKTNETLALKYLEHIINVGNDPSPMFHEQLIWIYIRQIKEINEKRNLLRNNNLSDADFKVLVSFRSKLIGVLEKSDKYCPERVYQFFPSENFFEERVEVLRRMNEHEMIFVIYIQILGNVEKALEYCEKVQQKDIFDILLKTLLNPLKTSPYTNVELHSDFLQPNHEIIIQILNKYATKINPDKIFKLLPGNIPLHRLKSYMEIVTRINMQKKWAYAMDKETTRSEILSLNQQIMWHRQKNSINLSELSICQKCEKRLSNQQVFVRNTGGHVMHLACFNKKTP